MRKGLVITLGVVALVFAVKPGFSIAPVISCIPDIIVSDAEQNQTVDQNFFVFSTALNLDELVRDDDTSKSQLRWSFFESAGSQIQVARKDSLTATEVADPAVLKDPGAKNLRAAGAVVAVRNKALSPVTGTLPYPAPGATIPDATLQMIVSDGVAVTSQAMIVKMANTGVGASTDPAAQKDARVPQVSKSYTFNTNQESWTWFTIGGFPAPTQAVSAGRLRMTEAAAQTPTVFGAWESPKAPTVALKNRWGCIMRARYKLFSSVAGKPCPGFRIRAIWTKVNQVGTEWIPNFLSQDMNDSAEIQVFTSDLDILFVPGRDPGTAGQTYTMLYYPQQTDTLMASDAITYITCDLLDQDTFGDDSGELSIDQVDVDGLARPAIGTGTSVPALSTTGDFRQWSTFRNLLDASGNQTGVTITSNTVSGITITGPRGTFLWNYGALSPGVALTSGRYYRAVFTCTSSQTPGGDFAPTLRTGVVGGRLVWVANKTLEGGGTYSMLTSTPKEFEMWFCAPSPYPATSTQTEPMSLRLEAYSLSAVNFVFNKNVSGTLSTSKVVTESFPAP